MRTRHRWIAAGILAAGLAGASFSGFMGADRLPVLAQLAAFRPQLAVVGLVVAAALARWLRAATLLVVAVSVLSLVGLAPRVSGELVDGPATTGLSVLTVSTARDDADLDAIAALVSARKVDVVALPEASAGYSARLGAITGYQVGARSSRPQGAGMGLLVRPGLAAEFTDGVPGLANSAVSVTLRVAGTEVVVHAVHPASPLPLTEGRWRADLAALVPPCRSSTPTLVVGDFNASPDHSAFRGLLDAGCRDVGTAAGGALAGTWPQAVPRALGTVIDHVLIAGPRLAPRSYEVLDAPGSDHRAVLAEIGVG